MDLVNGKPTGAIRASIGYMTRKSDIIRLVEVIKDCFLKGILRKLIIIGFHNDYLSRN